MFVRHTLHLNNVATHSPEPHIESEANFGDLPYACRIEVLLVENEDPLSCSPRTRRYGSSDGMQRVISLRSLSKGDNSPQLGLNRMCGIVRH